MKLIHSLAVAAITSTLCAQAHALDKAHSDSRSGHGQGRDVYLIKNSEQVANCGGPVSSQSNPSTGAVTLVCRVNGVPREVVKAPKGRAN